LDIMRAALSRSSYNFHALHSIPYMTTDITSKDCNPTTLRNEKGNYGEL